jgi:hypothetical protein
MKDPTDVNYCQETCFDFIFLKTLVIICIFGIIAISYIVLLIIGCCKNNDINDGDYDKNEVGMNEN